MTSTGIQKQLCDGLVDILASLQRVADKYQMDKELPKVSVEYFWMEEDEKGNGQGKHSQTLLPLFHRADTLLDQLLDKDPAMVGKVIEFGERARSIVDDKSFPVFIEANVGNDPLSVARSIIIQYIREARSLRISRRIAKQISTEFVNDITSPTYSVSFIFLVKKFRAPKPFQLSKSIKFRLINENDHVSELKPAQYSSVPIRWSALVPQGVAPVAGYLCG